MKAQRAARDVPRAEPPAPPGRAAALFAVAFGLLLTGAAANRFPLLWMDSGAYLDAARPLAALSDHPILYSLFLRAAGVAWSVWWPVAAQAAALAWLLLTLARAIGPAWPAPAIGAALATAILAGGVPWISGMLMPEVFSGCAAIALYLLAFHREALGWRAYAVSALALFSLAAHPSNVPTALLVLAGAWVLDARPRRLAWPAAVVLLSLPLGPLSSRALSPEAPPSAGAHNKLLCRMLEYGLVERLLDERCRDTPYVLCAHREKLRGQGCMFYHWSAESPLKQIGDWEHSGSVTWPMIIDSWARYPLENLASSLRGTLRQLRTFSVELPKIGPSHFVSAVLGKKYPDAAAGLSRSVQGGGDPVGGFGWLLTLHWAAAAASLIGAFGLLAFARDRLPASRRWVAFALLFVGANALACGTLSTVYGFYQWKVAWLAALAASLAAAEAWLGRRAERPAAPGEPWPRAGLARRAALAGAFALGGTLLGLGAARWLSSRHVATEPSLYAYLDPVVAWPGPARIRKRIPRRLLGSAEVPLGATLKSELRSGKACIGSVVATTADEVVIESPWEQVRWSSATPAGGKVARRVPARLFPAHLGPPKPGLRVEGFAPGVVTAVDGDWATVEFSP